MGLPKSVPLCILGHDYKTWQIVTWQKDGYLTDVLTKEDLIDILGQLTITSLKNLPFVWTATKNTKLPLSKIPKHMEGNQFWSP